MIIYVSVLEAFGDVAEIVFFLVQDVCIRAAKRATVQSAVKVLEFS
jgi:hypothetical protein